MASFIARGFELPATKQDFFPDDEGNTHEANINRVAAAGIAAGLEDGTYDPEGLVTRAQMASFLARAMGLDPVGEDRFDDVSGVHEGNINAIAEAGVTQGCDDRATSTAPTTRCGGTRWRRSSGRALGIDPINPPSTARRRRVRQARRRVVFVSRPRALRPRLRLPRARRLPRPPRTRTDQQLPVQAAACSSTCRLSRATMASMPLSRCGASTSCKSIAM